MLIHIYEDVKHFRLGLQADRIGETRYVRDDDLTRAAEVMLRHLPRHYGINALVIGPRGKKPHSAVFCRQFAVDCVHYGLN